MQTEKVESPKNPPSVHGVDSWRLLWWPPIYERPLQDWTAKESIQYAAWVTPSGLLFRTVLVYARYKGAELREEPTQSFVGSKDWRKQSRSGVGFKRR